MSDVVLSTGTLLEGRKVLTYLGIVSGEAIMGANFVKDLFANITDDWGGRSGVYEKEFERARSFAIDGLLKKARAKGANAVIGVRFDHLTLGANNGMMMVAVTGTAVLVSGVSSGGAPQILEKRYYIKKQDSEKGPFTKEQILELLAKSSIEDDTSCRVDGTADWSTVRLLLQE